MAIHSGFDWIKKLPIKKITIKERSGNTYKVNERKIINYNVDFCFLDDKEVYRVCPFYPHYAVSQTGKLLDIESFNYINSQNYVKRI
jgi:hypothetical protein